jgi:hypothetical protein
MSDQSTSEEWMRHLIQKRRICGSGRQKGVGFGTEQTGKESKEENEMKLAAAKDYTL